MVFASLMDSFLTGASIDAWLIYLGNKRLVMLVLVETFTRAVVNWQMAAALVVWLMEPSQNHGPPFHDNQSSILPVKPTNYLQPCAQASSINSCVSSSLSCLEKHLRPKNRGRGK